MKAKGHLRDGQPHVDEPGVSMPATGTGCGALQGHASRRPGHRCVRTAPLPGASTRSGAHGWCPDGWTTQAPRVLTRPAAHHARHTQGGRRHGQPGATCPCDRPPVARPGAAAVPSPRVPSRRGSVGSRPSTVGGTPPCSSVKPTNRALVPRSPRLAHARTPRSHPPSWLCSYTRQCGCVTEAIRTVPSPRPAC